MAGGSWAPPVWCSLVLVQVCWPPAPFAGPSPFPFDIPGTKWLEPPVDESSTLLPGLFGKQKVVMLHPPHQPGCIPQIHSLEKHRSSQSTLRS